MRRSSKPIARYWIAGLAVVLFASPVIADKHGRGHGDKHRQPESHHEDRSFDDRHEQQFAREPYFNDQHRSIVRDYYVEEYRTGRCPPGLAKKHNGCMPPGQAKRWAIGRPLPRDVVYFDLPSTVIQQIGYPPAGYRFVRVASDILMIAIGTGVVMDAITDLNGMP
jgi:Ni/Co efflux regulator RcnB